MNEPQSLLEKTGKRKREEKEEEQDDDEETNKKSKTVKIINILNNKSPEKKTEQPSELLCTFHDPITNLKIEHYKGVYSDLKVHNTYSFVFEKEIQKKEIDLFVHSAILLNSTGSEFLNTIILRKLEKEETENKYLESIKNKPIDLAFDSEQQMKIFWEYIYCKHFKFNRETFFDMFELFKIAHIYQCSFILCDIINYLNSRVLSREDLENNVIKELFQFFIMPYSQAILTQEKSKKNNNNNSNKICSIHKKINKLTTEQKTIKNFNKNLICLFQKICLLILQIYGSEDNSNTINDNKNIFDETFWKYIDNNAFTVIITEFQFVRTCQYCNKKYSSAMIPYKHVIYFFLKFCEKKFVIKGIVTPPEDIIDLWNLFASDKNIQMYEADIKTLWDFVSKNQFTYHKDFFNCVAVTLMNSLIQNKK